MTFLFVTAAEMVKTGMVSLANIIILTTRQGVTGHTPITADFVSAIEGDVEMKKDHVYWDNPWNPVTGCTPVSEACENCWAKAMVGRFPALHGGLSYQNIIYKPTPFSKIQFHPERLEAPLHWEKPRTVFVCNMSDLFHENIPSEWIHKVLSVCHVRQRHTFLFLTKRPERALLEFSDISGGGFWTPNMWLGVTVEHQKYVHRIDTLFQIPAAKRWVSFEPLLSEIKLPTGWNGVQRKGDGLPYVWAGNYFQLAVIGAESGPKRRPMKIEWAIDLVNQLRDVGVKVFVKQIDIGGKVVHDINQFPEALRIREVPE